MRSSLQLGGLAAATLHLADGAGSAIQAPGDYVREAYRALTSREREILEMLLSLDEPGFDELRGQVPFAEAARWACGCASFDVRVDRERAPRSSITGNPTVEAETIERGSEKNV